MCLKVWAVRRDRVRERYSLSCSRFVCARDGQREERERVLSVAWAAADSASEFDIPVFQVTKKSPSPRYK